MPRKKVKATSKRNKPKCPEGDEGNSLTEDERIEKLAVFTRDFDINFQQRLKRMESDQVNLLNTIETRIHCQLMHLPNSIRKMKLKDFIAAGGTVESALSSLVPTGTSDTVPPSLTISGKLAQKISKLNPKIVCEVIPEEDEDQTPCAEKRTLRKTSAKTGVRKSSRQKKTKGSNLSFMGAPPSTSKTRKTPAGRNMSTSSWSTPAITPKFDPRLPFTPGIDRDPKPGERLLSLAGSPINNPNDTNPKTRKKGRTRTKTLLVNKQITEELENIVIPNSPSDIKNMRQSQMFRAFKVLRNIHILSQSDDDEVY